MPLIIALWAREATLVRVRKEWDIEGSTKPPALSQSPIRFDRSSRIVTCNRIGDRTVVQSPPCAVAARHHRLGPVAEPAVELADGLNRAKAEVREAAAFGQTLAPRDRF
jgi:hypothetical protein